MLMRFKIIASIVPIRGLPPFSLPLLMDSHFSRVQRFKKINCTQKGFGKNPHWQRNKDECLQLVKTIPDYLPSKLRVAARHLPAAFVKTLSRCPPKFEVV